MRSISTHAPASAAAHSRRSSRSRAGLGAVLGTAVAALALAFGPASPALAHDQLVGTTPANGEVVATAPESLTLSFNNNIIEVGTVVNVTGPDGSSVAAGEPTVAGTEVVQALNPDLADGSYTVVWRVVSQDGHPISGTQSFAIGAASEGDETPAVPETEEEHSHEDSESTEEHSHDETMHTLDAEAGQASPWPWIGLGVAGVLAAGAVVFAVRASGRKKRASEAGATDSADTTGAPTE
ncbi:MULTISPECIES: copper resistance CopC family protein [unclassified Leucobacter]|uniref:copper resistance CopC family protein n=1 Tax=unclassified Leucobacter TaxID=2621730 RepID=UPI00165E5FB1|nr:MULTISPECIES: copper resistance CopC family protein [unclassified Leucobacter]MBC9935591.1 copper resistance protein CopC [Leucobacter sp. cx-87]